MLAQRVANVLNVGMTIDELKDVIRELPEDLESVVLPPEWTYWSSEFDVSVSLGDQSLTMIHYFVNQDTEQCLVWREGEYVTVVPCQEVGLTNTSTTFCVTDDVGEDFPDAPEVHFITDTE